MAHQPLLLTDMQEGTPHAPPALHQLQQQPLPRLGLHWQKELKALKNCAAALREPFSKQQVQSAPKSCSQANRGLDWPFLTRAPRCDPQTLTLSTTRATLWPVTPSFPLHKGWYHQTTTSWTPSFLSFLEIKSSAVATQSGLPLAQCLPDTCVAPPAVALCLSSFNPGERLIRTPQKIFPPHNRWMSCTSCESWLKSQWGKWLNLSLNPRQTASLVAVLQLLAIPRW